MIFLIAAGTEAERPTPPVKGMIRYNTDVELFEGYINDSWSIIGGVIDSDKDTLITADNTRHDEDVIRFYTNGNQRMGIFDGNSQYGSISDGTIDGNNAKNTTSGMEGGIAIGYGFNKPESTLHIKGNMIVSSNVNIRGDYFKLDTNKAGNKSIHFKSTGGMTVDLTGNVIETIDGSVTNTIGGNVVTTVGGTLNKIVTGISKETYKNKRDLIISGSYTELITGDVDITYNNTRLLDIKLGKYRII